MALSDRQSDTFDNPAKMACPEGNLRVLREAACRCRLPFVKMSEGREG